MDAHSERARSTEKPGVDAAWIKKRALEVGFTLVGIAPPEPPAHHAVYDSWIKAGRHAGMAYLAKPQVIAKRADPRRVLPECQSIIVTATAYNPPLDTQGERGEADIASYAIGDDYHHVLPARARQLVSEITDRLGRSVAHRIYTDTGPLLEREFAQRGGLGWIGKNTCLINPKLGSYFLLAEILVDLPLDPDPPFTTDHCGSCTRCIEACPTQCILDNRTIDAGRCISYLTIENKGVIPQDMRAAIGNWLFGCDICQQVCPWNVRFSQPVLDQSFQPRPITDLPRLASFLELAPGSWRQHLRESALERPRRKGLVRNAAIVAGNQASENWIESLSGLLISDPEPLVRRHAAWALGQIPSAAALQALTFQLGQEADQEVRHEISGAIDLLRNSTPQE